MTAMLPVSRCWLRGQGCPYNKTLSHSYEIHPSINEALSFSHIRRSSISRGSCGKKEQRVSNRRKYSQIESVEENLLD